MKKRIIFISILITIVISSMSILLVLSDKYNKENDSNLALFICNDGECKDIGYDYDEWPFDEESTYDLDFDESLCYYEGNSINNNLEYDQENNTVLINRLASYMCNLAFDKAPDIPELTFETIDEDEKIEEYNPGEWTNKTVKITIENYDYDNSDIIYQYSIDGGDWEDFDNGDTLEITESTDSYYQFRSIKGHLTSEETEEYKIMIDKEPPTVEIESVGFDVYNDTIDEYNINMNIYVEAYDGSSGFADEYDVYYFDEAADEYYLLTTLYSLEETIPLEMSDRILSYGCTNETLTIKVEVKDNAGNIAYDEYTFDIDDIDAYLCGMLGYL